MSDDVEITAACPDCDSTRVLFRTRSETSWHCEDCGAEFDQPIRRPSRRSRGGPVGGLASVLDGMDPDDLIADGGIDVRSSGLFPKYEVRKDGDLVEDCFVLEPETDLAARSALIAYANATDDQQLENDLWDWLFDIHRGGFG